MKLTAGALCVVLLVLAVSGVAAQPAPGPRNTCAADSDFLGVTATVFHPIPILEIQVGLENRSAGKLRVEPGMFAMTSAQTGRVSPLTLEQAKEVLQNPAQVLAGLLLFGLVGLFANVESQKRWTAYAETTLFRAADLPPGASARGSLFFRPTLSMTQLTLALEGLTSEAGEPLPPLVTNCRVPSQTAQPTPVATAEARTYVMTARATAGPITLRVQNAEFAREATTLTVSVENAGDVEANLFNAIADARLADSGGKTYTIRTLRSDLSDRIPPLSGAKGRLVFEPLPLPPTVKAATLTVPEIRVGEAVYTIIAELRF